MSENRTRRPAILVCEDDFSSRKLLTRILAVVGDVDMASNGCEAVEAVREARNQGERYDIICLDLEMPEMDGRDALRKIRRFEQDNNVVEERARILMTTATKSVKEVSAAYQGECDGYLVKPIRRAVIIEKLAEFGFKPVAE